MPWNQTTSMDQKMQFIADYLPRWPLEFPPPVAGSNSPEVGRTV